MGVFLHQGSSLPRFFCLPHARGGVSAAHGKPKSDFTSSPRPWGCFWSGARRYSTEQVFPTPVGVFPSDILYRFWSYCLPHARGGVSRRYERGDAQKKSSPRPWGCFSMFQVRVKNISVFPTPVGVFLSACGHFLRRNSLPHARGGVSPHEQAHDNHLRSSPRPWGCFRPAVHQQRRHGVFPTPVGVFLLQHHSLRSDLRLPHARGGVSRRHRAGCTKFASSPRPWGCF